MKALATARYFKLDSEPTAYLASNGISLIPCDYGGANADRGIDEETLIDLLKGAEAIISGGAPLSRKVMQACSNLRVVSIRGVGCDTVDLTSARDLGVRVTRTPGTVENAVAEFSLLLMLSLARQIVIQDPEVRHGIWRAYMGIELQGKTLGIVGFGRIGRSLLEWEMPWECVFWHTTPAGPILNRLRLERRAHRFASVACRI